MPLRRSYDALTYDALTMPLQCPYNAQGADTYVFSTDIRFECNMKLENLDLLCNTGLL